MPILKYSSREENQAKHEQNRSNIKEMAAFESLAVTLTIVYNAGLWEK